MGIHLICASPTLERLKFLVDKANECIRNYKKVTFISVDASKEALQNIYGLSEEVVAIEYYDPSPKKVKEIIAQYPCDVLIIDMIELLINDEYGVSKEYEDYLALFKEIESVSIDGDIEIHLGNQFKKNIETIKSLLYLEDLNNATSVIGLYRNEKMYC
jgi:hypothetical protein